jgi:hypothetical protein
LIEALSAIENAPLDAAKKIAVFGSDRTNTRSVIDDGYLVPKAEQTQNAVPFLFTEWVSFDRLSNATTAHYSAEKLVIHADQIGRNCLVRICSLKRIDMAHPTRQIAGK